MQLIRQAIPQNTVQTSRQRAHTTVEFRQRQGSKKEKACSIVGLCMARCRRAKRSCACNFRDAKVAFPSLEHHAITQAFRRRVPKVVSRLFEDLCSRGTMVLRLQSGSWRVWKLREARDRETAHEVMCSAQHTTRQSSRRRQRDKQDHTKCCSTTEGQLTRHSSPWWMTSQNSRLTRTWVKMMHCSIEKQIKKHTDSLVLALASIGCELEPKEGVVPAWMGTDSLCAAKRAGDEGSLTSGTKATTARCVGDFINFSGTNSTVI